MNENSKPKRKPRIISSILIGIGVFLIAIKLFFYFAEISHPKEMPSVPGPENSSLIEKAKGVFIYEGNQGDGLEAVTLPDKKKYLLSYQGLPGSPYLVAGPDKEGRIAYFSYGEGSEFLEKYYLILSSLKGEKPEILYTREGDLPHTNRDLEESLALSHTGGHLAFINEQEYYDKSNDSWHTHDTLEIWDINQKKMIDSIEDVSPYGFSWFPDGQKIAYASDGINVYDLRTKKETQIVPPDKDRPDNPIVRFDGKKIVFYRYYQEKSYEVDLDTKQEKEISLPGLWGYGGASAYLGFAAPNLLAFRALPTQGDASSGWTTSNSPLTGAKPLTTIKLSNLDTGEFQTVVSGIDPRDPASYGMMDGEPKNLPAERMESQNAELIIIAGGIIILAFVIFIFWRWRRRQT